MVVAAAIVVTLVWVAVKVVSVVVTVIAAIAAASRLSASTAWSGTISPLTAVGSAPFQPQPPPRPDVAVHVGRQVLLLKQKVGSGSMGVGVVSGLEVYVVDRWQTAISVMVVNRVEVTLLSVTVRTIVEVLTTVGGVGVRVTTCVGSLQAVVTVAGTTTEVRVWITVWNTAAMR